VSASTAGRARGGRLAARVALALGLPFAFVGCSQLALVAWGFHYAADAAPIVLPLPEGTVDGRSLHVRDARELWRPAPGELVPWGRDVINAAGFRGPLVALEKTPGVLRIATLGDSSTFGYGVNYAECWTAQLAERLDASGVRAECIDAGVIGSTVRQGLERYRVRVRPYRPDVVIAAFGAVNEHVSALRRSDDELIRTLAFEDGAAGRFARRLRADVRLVHVLAWLADESRGGRTELQAEERRERARRGRALGAEIDAAWPGERRVSIAEFAKFLRELDTEVRADGAQLVLLAPGRASAVYVQKPVVQAYTDATFEVARSLSLPLVDGRAALGVEGAEYDALYLDYYHPNPEGHRRLADALSTAVLELVRARKASR
jgi:lysophospholipase L1-like esterase